MGTYTTLNAYDGESRIPSFQGLNQGGDTYGTAPIYATSARNMDTLGGILQPFAPITAVADEEGEQLTSKIESLMHLHRRWPNQTTTPDDIIFAAAGGNIYFRKETKTGSWPAWRKVTVYQYDEEEEELYERPAGKLFASNVWSWETYEIATYNSVTGKTNLYNTDVLLLTNSSDGIYMVQENGLSFKMSPVDIGRDTTGDKYKPGIIERSNDRIWGAGFTKDPDMLMYSRYLDPTDWTAVQSTETITESDGTGSYTEITMPTWYGGGSVNQPSWDGDQFTAIRGYGSYLLAFKRNTIWQISGTNPGEYTMKEQYGGGCAYPQTIAVDSERVYMMSGEGVTYYNGSTTQAFNQSYCKDIWDVLNKDAMSESCAVLFKNKYYVSIPINGSTVNNSVIIYDLTDGTWLMRDDLKVESWMATESSLYFTTSDYPYSLCIYNEDSWLTGEASKAACYWESPWIDLNYRHYNKGPFTVYVNPEVQDRPVDLKIGIITETRKATKTLRVHPLLEWENNMGRSQGQKHVSFAQHSHKFKIVIQEDGETGAPWRINGGILTMMDVEKDG